MRKYGSASHLNWFCLDHPISDSDLLSHESAFILVLVPMALIALVVIIGLTARLISITRFACFSLAAFTGKAIKSYPWSTTLGALVLFGPWDAQLGWIIYSLVARRVPLPWSLYAPVTHQVLPYFDHLPSNLQSLIQLYDSLNIRTETIELHVASILIWLSFFGTETGFDLLTSLWYTVNPRPLHLVECARIAPSLGYNRSCVQSIANTDSEAPLLEERGARFLPGSFDAPEDAQRPRKIVNEDSLLHDFFSIIILLPLMILALLPSLPSCLPTHDDCPPSKDVPTPANVSLIPVVCNPPAEIPVQESSKPRRHRSTFIGNSDSRRISKSPVKSSNLEDLPQSMSPTKKSRSITKRSLAAHQYIELPPRTLPKLPKLPRLPYSPWVNSQNCNPDLTDFRAPLLHKGLPLKAPEPTFVDQSGCFPITSDSLALELEKSPKDNAPTAIAPLKLDFKCMQANHPYSSQDANPPANFDILHHHGSEFELDSSLNVPEQVYLWPGELSDELVEALLSAAPAVVIHPTTEQLDLSANFPTLSGEWGEHWFVAQLGQSVLPCLDASASVDPYQDFLSALSAARVSVSPIVPPFSCMGIEEDDLDVEMDEDVIMREDVETNADIWMDPTVPDTTMSSPEPLDADMFDPPTPPSPMALEYYTGSAFGDFGFAREVEIDGSMWAETAPVFEAMGAPTAGFGVGASRAPTTILEPAWTALAQPVDPSRLEAAMLGLVNALANKYAPAEPVQQVLAMDLPPTLPTWTLQAPALLAHATPDSAEDSWAGPEPATTLVYPLVPEPVQPAWIAPSMQPVDPHQLEAAMLGLVHVVANHYASRDVVASFQYVDPRQVDTASEGPLPCPEDLAAEATGGYGAHQPDLYGLTHALANMCAPDSVTGPSVADGYTATDEGATEVWNEPHGHATVASLAEAFAGMQAPGTEPVESGEVHLGTEATTGLVDGVQAGVQEPDELEDLLDSMRSLRANGISYESHTAESTQLAVVTEVVGTSAPDFVPLCGSDDEEEDTEDEEEDEEKDEEEAGAEDAEEVGLDAQDLASAEDFLARMQAEGLLGP